MSQPRDNEETARQLAARDRYARAINHALTPAERMAKFYALQKVCFDRLQRNPAQNEPPTPYAGVPHRSM